MARWVTLAMTVLFTAASALGGEINAMELDTDDTESSKIPKRKERVRGTQDPCITSCDTELQACIGKCNLTPPNAEEEKKLKDPKNIRRKQSKEEQCAGNCGKGQLQCVGACKR